MSKKNKKSPLELVDIDELVDYTDVLNSLESLKSQVAMVINQIKSKKKNNKKKVKQIKKELIKDKTKGNRKPSGFAKPLSISSELCKFLDKPAGTMVPRTEVTKYLCNYIRENNLNAGNGINPNKKLKELLNPASGDDQLTFFTMQKYMNKHFI